MTLTSGQVRLILWSAMSKHISLLQLNTNHPTYQYYWWYLCPPV